MLVSKLFQAALLLSANVSALALSGKPDVMIRRDENDGLQDIVTWDEVGFLSKSLRLESENSQ